MSLIADALKAAQKEKEKRTVRTQPTRVPREGFVPLRTGAGKTTPTTTRSRYVAIALIVVATGFTLAVLAIALLPSGGERLAEPADVALQPVDNAFAPDTVTADLGGYEEFAGDDPIPEPAWLSAEAPEPALSRPQPQPQPAAQPDGTAADPATTPAATAGAPRIEAVDEPAGPAAPALQITLEPRATQDVNAIFQQAVAAHRAGDHARALEMYERVIAAQPSNADAYNNLGAIHRSQRDFARAEEAYRRALAIDPTLAAAWSNLGVVLEALGKNDEAVAAFQSALRLDPSNAGTKANLGAQYFRAGLYPEARRVLDEAIAADPYLAEGHYILAQVLEAQRDVTGAVREFNLFLTTAGQRFPELQAQVRQHVNDLLRGQR